jgi:alanine racemase
VKAGDTVTLIGQDGPVRLSAEEMAACADTINYEITCNVSVARAERTFVGVRPR